MKVKLTPKQVLKLLEIDMLKEHPITMSGKSAKILHRYMKRIKEGRL